MSIAEPIIRRWTLEEYYRMGEMGLFEGQHVELIDGEVVQMAPQKDVHSAVIILAHRAVSAAFGSEYFARMQLPLRLSDQSEPEPDVSVVRGSPRDFIGTGHPRDAALVIEISDTTLLYDQRVKSALYASAGIQDYWIINLLAQRIEIHRQPRANALDWRASKYDDIRSATRGETITPVAAPQSAVSVADLLP